MPMSALLALSLLMSTADKSQNRSSAATTARASLFQNPPKQYRPETWFHFIGGNIGKEGITADLEAIAHGGLSGVQLFNGQFGGPWPGVPQAVCLTPLWDEMIAHTASECDRLGLKFAMEGCAGWSMAGGPWVPVSKAMRHLVSKRTDIRGGAPVNVTLAPSDMAADPNRDYRDVMVLAFPTPADDTGHSLVPAEVTGSGDAAQWKAVAAGSGSVELGPGESHIDLRFAEPVVVRCIELPSVARMTHAQEFTPNIKLIVEAMKDGAFQAVSRRDVPRSNWQDSYPLTLAIPDTKSTGFRIRFQLGRPIVLDNVKLYGGARTDDWEGKAGYTLRALDGGGIIPRPAIACIDPTRIVDLTSSMDSSGRLQWNAPAGNWTVLRFGHVYTGAKNGPAPAEATGPEVDKFDAEAVRLHFSHYIGRISGPTGPAGTRINGMVLDSWECVSQTWTPSMERLFAGLRGYALRPWLPALAGYVVRDVNSSERFLRDWRLTQSDLITDQFYGESARLAHERHLTTQFETGIGDVMTGDILRYLSKPDIPMCEFWWPDCPQRGGDETKPIYPTASAAHIYGKQQIAAESLTSVDLRYDESFFTWKATLDKALTQGVNKVVFHTYTHNPRIGVVPGTSFGAGIGSPFLRGQTWWPYMHGFTDYVARCEMMLQQGHPVADVLWFLGDEVDHKPRQDTPFPAGYHYDYCNADALQHRMSATPGAIRTPEGVAWRVLWLKDVSRTTPETLAAILRLLKDGAMVVGAPPTGSASLQGGPESERRIINLKAEIWGPKPGPSGDRKVGKGRIIWDAGGDIQSAISRLGVAPDLIGPDGLRWCHRRTADADIYFVAAGREAAIHGAIGLRARGNVEIFDPISGSIHATSLLKTVSDRTYVTLNLEPGASRFVVIRHGNEEPLVPIRRIDFAGKNLIDVDQPAHRVVTRPDIISAIYGVEGTPELQADVTDVVRRILASGAGSVSATNALAGDPALKHVKSLVVRVKTAAGEQTLRASENQSISFAQGAQAAPLAPVTLYKDLDPVAWQNGVLSIDSGDSKPTVAHITRARTIPLDRAWRLTIPAGWGAPEHLDLAKLMPWSDLDLPEARWFSGTAVYSTEFEIEKVTPGLNAMLDLGGVAAIASISVNGGPAMLTWAPPHRLDITEQIRAGKNLLRVEVTNTWRNRLSYDAGLPEAQRKTWTISGPGPMSSPDPAGLTGPVTVHIGQLIRLNNHL